MVWNYARQSLRRVAFDKAPSSSPTNRRLRHLRDRVTDPARVSGGAQIAGTGRGPAIIASARRVGGASSDAVRHIPALPVEPGDTSAAGDTIAVAWSSPWRKASRCPSGALCQPCRRTVRATVRRSAVDPWRAEIDAFLRGEKSLSRQAVPYRRPKDRRVGGATPSAVRTWPARLAAHAICFAQRRHLPDPRPSAPMDDQGECTRPMTITARFTVAKAGRTMSGGKPCKPDQIPRGDRATWPCATGPPTRGGRGAAASRRPAIGSDLHIRPGTTRFPSAADDRRARVQAHHRSPRRRRPRWQVATGDRGTEYSVCGHSMSTEGAYKLCPGARITAFGPTGPFPNGSVSGHCLHRRRMELGFTWERCRAVACCVHSVSN